jgi:hypothetical protein
MKNNFGFRRAGQITVPDEFFNPVKTGIPEADRAFSEMGGIIPSQVIFVTGKPGAGKTTLTLAIGSRLIRHDRPVAFISLEMSEFQIAHQARKIPNFRAVHVTDDFDQDATLQYLRELKPGLVILDSIQKAARKMRDEEGRQLPFNTAQFEIVNMFTHFAKETWTPVCLIGHCDKSGNYKGPSDLLHDVDSHMLVNYDKEMDLRTFEFGKNRFGGEMGETLFGFSSSGVWIGSPFFDPDLLQEEIVVEGPELVPNPLPDPGPTHSVSNAERARMALKGLEETWNAGTVRAACNTLISYLQEVDEGASETYIGDWKKVKVQFTGKGAGHCVAQKGLIVFGKGCVTGFDFSNIGYKKEKPYISRNCTTKAQLLAWVVVHEWCHLNKEMQHHKHEFFQLVEKKYTEMVAGLF